MNKYLILLISLCLMSLQLSCSTMNTSKTWPARTYDKELIIRGPKAALSKKDIASIHEFVWQKYPTFRIFGIQVIDSRTVLISCSNLQGESFPWIEGMDLIRTGSTWKYGKYHARHAAYKK